jgi:hypothetical protein
MVENFRDKLHNISMWSQKVMFIRQGSVPVSFAFL